MQPLGRKPVRFPSKTDVHPKAPLANWWEVEISTDNDKKSERQRAKRELDKELTDTCADE